MPRESQRRSEMSDDSSTPLHAAVRDEVTPIPQHSLRSRQLPVSEVVTAAGDLAEFDGLVIHSDGIHSRLLDRVMPILLEEQVLMCRLMRPALESGRRLLDVGTGSGIFALYAAQRGCDVTGLDIAARAIAFAEQNAFRNRIAVSASDEARGGVRLIHTSVEDFARFTSERFDIVVLNPPFNPTWEGIQPAIHANGGPDGMVPFQSQISLVPQLLRPGGRCFGYQMSIGFGSHSAARHRIRATFGPTADIAYATVLDDLRRRDAVEFLTAQYAGIRTSSNAAALNAYIQRVGGGGWFELICYEVQLREAGHIGAVTCRHIEKVPRTWTDRELLHRAIVTSAQPR